MRFGESFPQGADPKNRMDVLRIEETDGDAPECVKFGLEIRKKLKDRVEKLGWPDLPDSESIIMAEDIFAAAKSEVDKTWDESIQQIIDQKAQEWAQNLNEDSSEAKQARDLLNNPEELKRSFSLRQFGVLEVLRKSNQDAWRTLVMASSERQLASIAVMEHWLKYSDGNKLAAVCEKIGLSPQELSLFIDTAAILGKYVDHTYVKQIELADLPGGSSESKLSQEDGAQYLYDLYKKSDIEKIDAANPEDKNVSVKGSENKDLDIKTYSDIFPYEWDKIESRLLSLSARVKNDVQEKKLPAYYEAYGSLLEKTANVYGSKVITPEILDKEWEDLYDIAKSVYDSDCPLMIIPQGCTSVAGEAGKIDAEIRLGLKTKETKQQEQGLNKFTQIAQEMLSVYDVGLDKSRPVPKVNLNYQPWAFGPNLYWQTRGESGESQILSHTNAVSEVAIAKELPLVEKVFDRKNISDEQYARASVVETVLHETGHCVIEYTDKKVAKRIGKSFEVDILEELKAESIGMKILAEAMKRGELPTEIDIKAQLLAKLGANLDYLKNKSSEKASSGEPYYICGVAIISNLLDKRLIVKNNSTYEISDPEACIKEIASLSDEILPFYTNDETKPADVKNYIKKLRNRGQEPLIKDFIKDL